MGRTLSEHAAYELTKAGLTNNEEPEARQVALNTLALIRRLEKQNNNEKQFQYVVEGFQRLAQRMPLTPITDDPEEWEQFEITSKNIETGKVEAKTTWQSKRLPSLFSEDGGKTFVDQRTGKTGESLDHKKVEEEEAAAKKDREKRKAKAEKRNAKPIPHVDADVPAAETTVGAEETPEVAATPEQEAPAEEAKKETK